MWSDRLDFRLPAFGSCGIEGKAQDVRREDGLRVLGSVASLLESL